MRKYHGLQVALLGLALTAWHVNPSLAQRDRRQTRPAETKVSVAPEQVQVGDGDTVRIDWGEGDVEIVRILGIDTPETRNVEHNLPYDQPFGREATQFARGAFAVATQIELLRAAEKDPYGRTLGYLFLNDKNYSVLIVRARLAAESVSHYGDNGFPLEAEAVLEAARAAGPVPFEMPHEYRRRMRMLTEWMRETGRIPSRDD